MELIDKAKLYNAIAEMEDEARDVFLNTMSSPHKEAYMGRVSGITAIKHLVADFPTVESRPRGEWIDVEEFYFDYKCSLCGGLSEFDTPFCQNCGADMRKKV